MVSSYTVDHVKRSKLFRLCGLFTPFICFELCRLVKPFNTPTKHRKIKLLRHFNEHLTIYHSRPVYRLNASSVCNMFNNVNRLNVLNLLNILSL